MTPNQIITKDDYQRALEKLSVLFDALKGTPESEEADLLSLFVDEFEMKHFPIH